MDPRWSQCACEISAVEHRVFICNASSKYVSWKKSSWKSCKEYASSIVLYKRTNYGLVKYFRITDYLLDKIKMQSFFKTCFTLRRNMNNQSNILLLRKSSCISWSFLYMNLKCSEFVQSLRAHVPHTDRFQPLHWIDSDVVIWGIN